MTGYIVNPEKKTHFSSAVILSLNYIKYLILRAYKTLFMIKSEVDFGHGASCVCGVFTRQISFSEA